MDDGLKTEKLVCMATKRIVFVDSPVATDLVCYTIPNKLVIPSTRVYEKNRARDTRHVRQTKSKLLSWAIFKAFCQKMSKPRQENWNPIYLRGIVSWSKGSISMWVVCVCVCDWVCVLLQLCLVLSIAGSVYFKFDCPLRLHFILRFANYNLVASFQFGPMPLSVVCCSI